MPTTYTQCDNEIGDRLEKVIAKYHPDLHKAQPTFNCLFAWNETTKPLKLHGYPCLAVIKVNKLDDRAKGMADVTLKIDGKRWAELKEPDKTALLHHEICHLVPKLDKEDKPKLDDLERPLLGTRHHDFELGGFQEVIEAHKTAAVEAQQIDQVARLVQGMFPWG